MSLEVATPSLFLATPKDSKIVTEQSQAGELCRRNGKINCYKRKNG
jgi:hypothetical protein